MSESKGRIVVTGGNGKLGRAVVQEFADAGYDVMSADFTRGEEFGRVRTVQADLRNLGEVMDLVSGPDNMNDGAPGRARTDTVGIVHLAATPSAEQRTPGAIYPDNTTISYNIFHAARVLGVKRVVFASSETLLGLPLTQFPPPAFPVDEEYAVRPRSSYSLSKAVDEEVARHFAEWLPDSAFIGLRFSNVMLPSDYARFSEFESDPMSRAWNAWGYVDARDGAQACRLAVESELLGVRNYIVAAADTVMSRPSTELANEFFPGVPFSRAVEGNGTLLSIDKAERELGYRPKYRWSDQR